MKWEKRLSGREESEQVEKNLQTKVKMVRVVMRKKSGGGNCGERAE